jgi:thioesterase domain-containing protein
MARRQAIEPEELFETANRMRAEGKEVTAMALLDALGGGSLSTIYKHLEVWQATRPAEVVIKPEEIPAAVQASFAAAWRLAAQEAKREVTEVKEKAKEEVAAALRQFHGALEAIAKIEKDREADAESNRRVAKAASRSESGSKQSGSRGSGRKGESGRIKGAAQRAAAGQGRSDKRSSGIKRAARSS